MKTKIDLIGYCGLYCPRCYRMKVAGAAEKLMFELEQAQAKGAKYLQQDSELKKKIAKLIKLKCETFCRARQGQSPCVIKNCCLDKKLLGCWKCAEMRNCQKLNQQFLKNCIKIKEVGIAKFIKQYN